MLRALLLAYVATLPLVQADFLRLPLGKTVVPSDLVFLALLVWLATNRGRWRWPSPTLLVVAAIPPAFMLLTALATETPFNGAAREVLRTTYSMVVLLVMVALPQDGKLESDVTRAWCATSLLVCAIGLASYLAVTLFGAPENALARSNSGNLGPGVVRISGVLPTNSLTLYLVISAAFAIALAEHGRTPGERGLGRAALAAAIVVSALALSRGVVGLAAFLALLAFRRESAPRWLAKLRWPTALAAVLLAGAALAVTWWAGFPLERTTTGGWALNRQPNGNRVLHSAGLRMFASHPLTGVGPGAFGKRLGTYSTPEERSGSWPPVPVRGNRDWTSHSAWIRFLAEGGLPAFVAWIALFALIVRDLLAGPPNGTAPLLGLALVGIALNGLHTNFEHLKFIWAAAGLGLAARGAVSSAPAERGIRSE